MLHINYLCSLFTNVSKSLRFHTVPAYLLWTICNSQWSEYEVDLTSKSRFAFLSSCVLNDRNHQYWREYPKGFPWMKTCPFFTFHHITLHFFRAIYKYLLVFISISYGSLFKKEKTEGEKHSKLQKGSQSLMTRIMFMLQLKNLVNYG